MLWPGGEDFFKSDSDFGQVERFAIKAEAERRSFRLGFPLIVMHPELSLFAHRDIV